MVREEKLIFSEISLGRSFVVNDLIKAFSMDTSGFGYNFIVSTCRIINRISFIWVAGVNGYSSASAVVSLVVSYTICDEGNF